MVTYLQLRAPDATYDDRPLYARLLSRSPDLDVAVLSELARVTKSSGIALIVHSDRGPYR